MALPATIYHLQVTVSDIDRGVYETLDLRLARHPSETMRYLLTRTIAYCLSYQDGIAFSKGGLSSSEEPPITVRDPTGLLVAWIDVGVPSAERLHKATKAAATVALFTTAERSRLRREAATRPIHRVEDIVVWRMGPPFLDALEALMTRNSTVELVRHEENLYVTVDGAVVEGTLTRASLAAAEDD